MKPVAAAASRALVAVAASLGACHPGPTRLDVSPSAGAVVGDTTAFGPRLLAVDGKSHTVTFRVDDAGFIEDVLRLLPETERIAVVYGASPLEKFWVAETRRAWQPLTGRVELVWDTTEAVTYFANLSGY